MHMLLAAVLTSKRSVNSMNSELLGVCQLPPLQSSFLSQNSSKQSLMQTLNSYLNLCHFSAQVSSSHVCQREAAAAKESSNFLSDG